MHNSDKFIEKIEKRFNKNKPTYYLHCSNIKNNEVYIYLLIKEVLRDVKDIEIVTLGGVKQNESN